MSGSDKQRILIVEKVYLKAKEVFDSVESFELVLAPVEEKALSEKVKAEKAFGVVLGGEKYTGSLYESFGGRGLLARFGVGYDGIDLQKAKANHLLVTYTPGVLESTVGEFTIFLAAEVLRKIGAMDGELKKGTWSRKMGSDLHGKVWAVVGLGRIGKRLSQMLSFGFGVKVLALNRSQVDPERMRKDFGIEKVFYDFSEMAPLADIISLHLPARKETHHFLDQARLELLKPGAILINTGRGSLIDENALYDSLKKDRLAGAGLDVFEHEPYQPTNPEKDLRTIPKLVMTPHMASSTWECSGRMAERVIQNIQFAIEKKYAQMDLVPENERRI